MLKGFAAAQPCLEFLVSNLICRLITATAAQLETKNFQRWCGQGITILCVPFYRFDVSILHVCICV